MLITLDLETYYDRDYSLSKMTTEAYVRDPRFEVIGISIQRDDEPPYWFPKPQVAAALKSIDWSQALVVAQNTMFDGAILAWHYGINPKGWIDIMGMSRALYPHEKSHSLKAQAERMGVGVKGDEVINALGKRYKDFDQESLARYGAYCNNDVDLTYQLFQMYMQEFPVKELKLIDLTLRMFIQPALVLDRLKLLQHLGEVRRRKQALLESTTVDKDNLMSNPKFAALLIERGVTPPMKKSLTTGKETYAFAKTDEEFQTLAEHVDPEVQALVAARLGTKSTIEETRTESLIAIAERSPLLPIPLKYYGAHSGRWSGQDSINLQNLPARGENAGHIKRAILAPAGHVVIDCDSSQIEARTLAWLAGQEDLIKAFENKEDVYKIMASRIYDKPIEEISKGERQVGKTVILGCFGPDTLVLTQRGWVPIVEVLATDTVWDGQEWVQHQGVVPQGEKEVLTAMGLSATSDHEILTERGWVAWSEVLQNPCHLQSALSLASLPASLGIDARQTQRGLASMDTSLACGVPAVGKGSWTAPTYAKVELNAATPAPNRSQDRLGLQLPSLLRYAPTMLTAAGFSPALAPSSLGVPTRRTRFTFTTAGEGYRFIPHGWKIAQNFCGISSALTGGITRIWSWIAGITTPDTFRGIFGSLLKAKTCPTGERFAFTKSNYSGLGSSSLNQRMQTYDIAYAGPRNRYTVWTSSGPLIVHNCGYGVGATKMRLFLKTVAGVDVTEDEAKRIVQTYRRTYPRIPELWKRGDKCLVSLSGEKKDVFDAQKLIPVVPKQGLQLPSGLYIQYPYLAREYDKDDMAVWRYTTRGVESYIYGGKVVENVCQAVARCIIAEQMLRISKRYRPVMTVHDSIVVVAPEAEAQEAQAFVEECMSWRPKWAPTLPLACESGVGVSYGDC